VRSSRKRNLEYRLSQSHQDSISCQNRIGGGKKRETDFKRKGSRAGEGERGKENAKRQGM
jgi:hypothetical protein